MEEMDRKSILDTVRGWIKPHPVTGLGSKEENKVKTMSSQNNSISPAEPGLLLKCK